ncbi:kunitz-type protease inhibitor 1 [Spea bombifrons]|uniref:kunitz-type protease inhibitor 1 n=1 Tax=Spea bombifrons TaxID=233779 RepID=UPI00234BC7D1|nr:kunitz-type protease inhibitor 1 [Spea bombifrons]
MWLAQGVLVLFLMILPLVCSESFQETCLNNFTKGVPNFVLDLDESVKNGAIFLSAPALSGSRDCITSCCKTLGCNLVLVQPTREGEDAISSCFLLNCLYKGEFVCKFFRNKGLVNYVTLGVYKAHLERKEDQLGDDEPPIARVSRDVKTQPFQTVTLSGIESWDNEGIVDYEWSLIQGDPSVVLQKLPHNSSLEVSNLEMGHYVIQLIVTDTASQQSTATTTITVLSKEETEDYCLAPVKTGSCRAKFSRWHYNVDMNDCEEFTFGGCKPNKNNYVRKEDCLQTCRTDPGHSAKGGRRSHPVCDGQCHPTQFRCDDGCCIDAALECDETPDCGDGSDEASCDKYYKGFKKLQALDVSNNKARCVDLPDTGPCRASFNRWYYDPDLTACMSFTYGGCGGNGNNFNSEKDCLLFCSGINGKDIFGVAREDAEARDGSSGSAQVAIAVFLGICILVVLAVIGYCYLKRRKGSRRRQPAVNNSALSATEDTEHLYNPTTKPV